MHADTKNVVFRLSNKVTEFSAVWGLGFRMIAKQIIEFLVKATSILSSMIDIPNSIATRYLLLAWAESSSLKYLGLSHQKMSYTSVVLAVENSDAFTSISDDNY